MGGHEATLGKGGLNMFFISWGSRGALAEIGPAGVHHCTRCGHDAHFTQMLLYRIRHVWWIFRWVTNKVAFLQCSNCGSEYMADLSDFDPQAVRTAISFWDRRGWTIGVGAIASVFALGSIAAAADSAADKGYVQAPHVGDIYETDMARMMKNPEAPTMLSALRVTKVEGGKVEVELGKLYYADTRGLDRDVNTGKTANEDYYSGDRMSIPIAELSRLYADGVVQDVRR